MGIHKRLFGQTIEGEKIDLHCLTNSNGLEIGITNYGATIVFIKVPDRDGEFADVALGYDTLSGYIEDKAYFGVTVGRYANRIAKGKFTLDGSEYLLTTNNGQNHLHGGLKGFNKVVWSAEKIITEEVVGLKLNYFSRDREEGYPGNLDCTVVYTLTNNDELKIEYEAMTDKSTVVNLTNHSYFNLAGQGTCDVLGHELRINANTYTSVDEELIPTGEVVSVKNSPMDFVNPALIGSRITQVQGGYDHNYVLNSEKNFLTFAAKLYEHVSGRVMEVYTSDPAIQFYSGNFLDGSITGKSGRGYHKYYGLCLEAQRFPDSPNRPNFPSVVLRPGETYTQTTIYKFYTD